MSVSTSRRQYGRVQGLEVQGAHVSSKGLVMGQRDEGYSALLYRPPLPAARRPDLTPGLRFRHRMQESTWLPGAIKRRFWPISAAEKRELYEDGLVTGLLRYFGEGASRTLDNFNQIQPYTWYLHASAKAVAPVSIDSLKTISSYGQLRRAAKSNVTRQMDYMERCIAQIIEIYRIRYQAQYGSALKKDHFGVRMQQIFQTLPPPHDLRTLQRQSLEAQKMRQRTAQLTMKDVDKTRSELEYGQAELHILQALMYSQLSVLAGHVPFHELMMLMDYISPAHHAWFLMRDQDETIVKILIDKMEFNRSGRRLTKTPPDKNSAAAP
jgi:hypothetical protein